MPHLLNPRVLVPDRLNGPALGDVVAGLSVALLAIPQSLAYAELAGLPPQYGLYASALPSILAALFVSSKYLQTGPVALTALLTFGALSPIVEPGSADYIAMAAMLALLVGLLRMVFGLLRLGRLGYLLSDPVLTGFTSGAGTLIIASQLPRVVGADPGDRGVVGNAVAALADPTSWHPGAVGFALATAVTVVVGRRLNPMFPGVLISVVGAIAISRLIGYSGPTVGTLDGGVIPPFGLDLPWSDAGRLVVPAIAIALVGFAEPSSIARTFAAAERLSWDADKEMFGQGVANVAAGLSGAFPVGGSFSRSSLNRMAGAVSPWAGAITGVVVLLALPLTPMLAPLPTTVLGAVVVVAVAGLLKPRTVVDLFRRSAPQGLVAVGTFAATIVASPRVERGVLIGIALAIAVHLYRELSVTVDGELVEGSLVVRPRGVIWFATVPSVETMVRQQLASDAGVEVVVLDLGGVGRLDYTGAAALGRLIDELRDNGVRVVTVNVPPAAARAARIHLEPRCGASTTDRPRPDR